MIYYNLQFNGTSDGTFCLNFSSMYQLRNSDVPKTIKKALVMAKVVTPLTDTKIKESKAKDKDYTLADGNGLQLLIKTNVAKLWEFRYNSPTTAQRRKTSLGNYPTVKLKNARTKRAEYQELIINNIDPIEHNRKLKEEFKEKESNKVNTI